MSKAVSKRDEKRDAKIEVPDDEIDWGAKSEVVPDAKSEEGLEGDMQDAKRYRWLRDMCRNGDGTINERIYVRCDGRYGGEWALDGEKLDAVLDALIINVLDAAADEVVAEAEKA
jgi:hypothetical protein